jgi:hypothetical protein
VTNPFETDETNTTAAVEELEGTDVVDNTSGDEDVDVDTPDLDEVDETETADAADEKPTKEKKVKEKKEPARPPIAEGYVSPVGFAKLLTAKLIEEGKLEEGKSIPPQQMYSTINSTKAGKNPFPTHEVGERKNLIVPAEGFAWWDEKDARVAERKGNAAAKAEKKANKAPAATDTEAVEAEATEAEVFDGAEAE